MYLITNRHLCDNKRYLDVLKEASYSGVEYIILREKDLSDYELENLYFKVRSIVKYNTKIIINNNINVYKKVKADGIHLSFESFLYNYEKGLINEKDNKIIGVSTHSIDEIIEVNKKYADYVFLSHIYETKCKENLKPKGIEILKEAKKILNKSKLKLIALGGIIPNNAKETLKYCDDIAVMSTIMKSENVEKTISEYL